MGTTENAVNTKVYIAVITYALVAIIKQKLKSKYSTYEILQILGTSLLNETQVNQLLQKKNYTLKEVTSQLGKAIGKPDLPYIEITPSDFINGIIASGRSGSFANTYLEIMTATNNGLLNYEKRTAENTTATTLQEFAETVFALVYNQQ